MAHAGISGFAYRNPFATVTVPCGPLTWTVARPTLPAGVTAVMVVGFTTAKPVHGAPLILTPVIAPRFWPVMVSGVPPDTSPYAGEIVPTDCAM